MNLPVSISPERLSALDEITLTVGQHNSPEAGMCAMEAAAWLAGEEHSDTPECVDETITEYVQVLNDHGGPEVRERLKSYVPQMLGTATGPEHSLKRDEIARAGQRKAAARWLRLLNLDDLAAAVEADDFEGLYPYDVTAQAYGAARAAARTVVLSAIEETGWHDGEEAHAVEADVETFIDAHLRAEWVAVYVPLSLGLERGPHDFGLVQAPGVTYGLNQSHPGLLEQYRRWQEWMLTGGHAGPEPLDLGLPHLPEMDQVGRANTDLAFEVLEQMLAVGRVPRTHPA